MSDLNMLNLEKKCIGNYRNGIRINKTRLVLKVKLMSVFLIRNISDVSVSNTLFKCHTSLLSIKLLTFRHQMLLSKKFFFN